MISISSQDFFVAYISLAFASISALWVRELVRSKAYDWKVSAASLCVCGKCHYTFLVKPGEKLAHCPRCADLCVVKKHKR